jgi:DNA-binding FadR family transcriptional regulator
MTTADRATGEDTTGDESLDRIISSLRSIRSEDGELPAERQLAERIGVKRHQLRRALQRMRDGNELAPAPPRKRKISESRLTDKLVRSTNPMEVVELRIMIEPTLARLAAMRATPNMILAMKSKVASISEPANCVAARQALHKLIAEASGNNLAAELYNMVSDIEAETHPSQREVSNAEAVAAYTEHAAIIDAIAMRAPEPAERAMMEHLAAVRRTILRGFE